MSTDLRPLPESWQLQVVHAYATFGVDPGPVVQFGFLGDIKAALRGARKYWTSPKLRQKALKQARDTEGRWIDMPDAPRASTKPAGGNKSRASLHHNSPKETPGKSYPKPAWKQIPDIKALTPDEAKEALVAAGMPKGEANYWVKDQILFTRDGRTFSTAPRPDVPALRAEMVKTAFEAADARDRLSSDKSLDSDERAELRALIDNSEQRVVDLSKEIAVARTKMPSEEHMDIAKAALEYLERHVAKLPPWRMTLANGKPAYFIANVDQSKMEESESGNTFRGSNVLNLSPDHFWGPWGRHSGYEIWGDEVVAHELGHMLDEPKEQSSIVSPHSSESYAAERLWKFLERSSGTTEYGATKPVEGYAEAWASWISERPSPESKLYAKFFGWDQPEKPNESQVRYISPVQRPAPEIDYRGYQLAALAGHLVATGDPDGIFEKAVQEAMGSRDPFVQFLGERAAESFETLRRMLRYSASGTYSYDTIRDQEQIGYFLDHVLDGKQQQVEKKARSKLYEMEKNNEDNVEWSESVLPAALRSAVVSDDLVIRATALRFIGGISADPDLDLQILRDRFGDDHAAPIDGALARQARTENKDGYKQNLELFKQLNPVDRIGTIGPAAQKLYDEHHPGSDENGFDIPSPYSDEEFHEKMMEAVGLFNSSETYPVTSPAAAATEVASWRTDQGDTYPFPDNAFLNNTELLLEATRSSTDPAVEEARNVVLEAAKVSGNGVSPEYEQAVADLLYEYGSTPPGNAAPSRYLDILGHGITFQAYEDAWDAAEKLSENEALDIIEQYKQHMNYPSKYVRKILSDPQGIDEDLAQAVGVLTALFGPPSDEPVGPPPSRNYGTARPIQYQSNGHNIVFHGLADPTLQEHMVMQQHREDLDTVPRSIAEFVASTGTTVQIIPGTVTEVFPELRGVTPRGWEGTGMTWDDVPGTHYKGQVVVGNNPYHPQAGHGSLSLALHEYGHAVDKLYGDLSGGLQYGDMHDEIKWVNPYYRQPWPAGEKESFAELFAMMKLTPEERMDYIETLSDNPEDFQKIENMFQWILRNTGAGAR